ncbi:hypothetical protein [Verrucomicrobium sp. BvORR106]|uniref:hypothetical protein n=1 Tax=Verrucomicrobium sp. BvORR106 TaxID=1403819 RepID=UPI002240F85F|nr:hypothetical protein [Verrucomicrobium sp. BvORR106]
MHLVLLPEESQRFTFVVGHVLLPDLRHVLVGHLRKASIMGDPDAIWFYLRHLAIREDVLANGLRNSDFTSGRADL